MPTLIVDKIELKKQSGTLVAAMLMALDAYGNVIPVPLNLTPTQYNDLVQLIGLKANDNNVVKLFGNQSIDGVKTFLKALTTQGDFSALGNAEIKGGFLGHGDITTGGRLIKIGGLPTQFLKANGDLDLTVYATDQNLTLEKNQRIAADDLINLHVQNLLAGIDPAALASLNDLIIAYRNANGDLLVAVDLIGTNLSNVIDVEIRNRIAADLLLAPIKDPIFTGNGITIPRLTTSQITAIVNPVQGTLVFNTDTNLVECFGGAIWSKSWNYLNGFYSVQNELQIQTTSIVDEIATGMSIAPIAGTYKVDFTANYDIVKGNVVTQATLDLQILTLYLQNKPATGSHVLMFVSGEIILPGVYDINGAAALAGIITLDAQGDPNALFVFRVVGAINSVAGTTFVLANGASANNIFWTATGAIVLVANNVLYGNFISLGEAVSVGANSNLTGRLFSKAGAVAFSSGIQNKPTGTSVAPLGILETFIVFTAIGDVNNAALTIIKGNIGTAFGIINMFLNSIYTGKLYDDTQKMGNTNVFSIYANEALIKNSERKRYSDNYLEEITLTAVITVAEGQSVDIRWRTDVGIVYLKNRIFTLTRLG